MLEETLRRTRPTEASIQLHPSTNNVFSAYGKLEQGIFTPHRLLREWVQDRRDARAAQPEEPQPTPDTEREEPNPWAEAVPYLETGAVHATNGLTHALYLTAEVGARVTESLVRGTGRTLGWLARTAYNRIDPETQSGIKQWLQQKITRAGEIKDHIGERINEKLYGSLQEPDLGRRKLLVEGTRDAAVAAGALALGATTLGILLSDDEQPIEPQHGWGRRDTTRPGRQRPTWGRQQPTRPTTPRTFEREPLPIDDISEFRDIQNVLVYCASEEERSYVMTTLRQKNRQRARGSKMRFLRNNRLDYDTVIDRGVEMKVVIDGNHVPDVGGYQMIQLRGHTNDMQTLMDGARPYKNGHVIVHFGGCNGRNFIEDNAQDDTALFGGIGTQDGSMNTYLLLKIPEHMRRSNSWDQFKANLESQSERVRSGELVFPGTANYVRR